MKTMRSLVIFAPLLAGCLSTDVPRLSIRADGAIIEARILSVEPVAAKNHGSLVFGQLRIVAQTRITSANLDCFVLSWNAIKSEKIYVDSIASVLTNPFPIDNREITVNVYWVFSEASLESHDLGDIRIEKSDAYIECLTYSA